MADALNVPSPDQIESYHGIVGRSDAFKAVINTVEKISKPDTPVSIQGDTGNAQSPAPRAANDDEPSSRHACTRRACMA